MVVFMSVTGFLPHPESPGNEVDGKADSGIKATFSLYQIAFRGGVKKTPIPYGMYNFQKLSETTSLSLAIIPRKIAFLRPCYTVQFFLQLAMQFYS
jgi:hypothetical protein